MLRNSPQSPSLDMKKPYHKADRTSPRRRAGRPRRRVIPDVPTGVSRVPRANGSWAFKAQVYGRGIPFYLGIFSTAEAAHESYLRACSELGDPGARGDRVLSGPIVDEHPEPWSNRIDEPEPNRAK